MKMSTIAENTVAEQPSLFYSGACSPVHPQRQRDDDVCDCTTIDGIVVDLSLRFAFVHVRELSSYAVTHRAVSWFVDDYHALRQRLNGMYEYSNMD